MILANLTREIQYIFIQVAITEVCSCMLTLVGVIVSLNMNCNKWTTTNSLIQTISEHIVPVSERLY